MGCEKLLKISETVGSDITYMLRGGLGRLRGKGDWAVFFSLKNPLYFALTTFAQELSSGEIYAIFDKLTHGHPNEEKYLQYACSNEQFLTFLQRGDNDQALKYFANDLQQATVTINDYAEQYLSFCNGHGLNTVMTGSGSAYYIAFSDSEEAKNAVKLLNSNGFDTTFCQSVPNGIEIIE